jgi:hypothetical protein
VAAEAGYSGTPLAKKLGIKDGAVLALIGAPARWSVPDLPAGVKVRRVRSFPTGSTRDLSVRDVGRPTPATDKSAADVTLAFCRTPGDVVALVAAVESVPPTGALWVAWPRKAGGHVSDVDENLLREVLLPTGIVDVKVAALDTDWSGLKFVWRKENRAK